PVDHRLQVETDSLAGRADDRTGNRTRQRDRLLHAADLELAPDDDLVAVAAYVRGRERDTREALGVEEVGGEQMALEVLVLNRNAGDRRRTAQQAVLEDGVEVGHAALEEGDATVPHGVRRARVRGVERPRPGGNRLLGKGAGHRFSFVRYNYLRPQATVPAKRD